MLVNIEKKMVEQKTYSLGSEEISALSTAIQIIAKLHYEGYYKLGNYWDIVDYLECIDFIKTIIEGNNVPQIID